MRWMRKVNGEDDGDEEEEEECACSAYQDDRSKQCAPVPNVCLL